MKLNVQENLKNLEMYFCEALGYRSYKESNTPHNVFYNDILESEYLVLEVSSVRHMLQGVDQERVCGINLREILDGKAPIPETAYWHYGNDDARPFWHPCIMVAAIKDEINRKWVDGSYKIYCSIISGSGNELNEPALNYFLYCYNRKDRHFRDVPQETVDKIEDFLRSRGREIYDRR